MPLPIIYRSTKGSPLTNNEVDGNFRALATAADQVEVDISQLETDLSGVSQVANAAQVKLVAGDNIEIDDTDPAAPVISASGGGGTGTVQTVAGVPPVEGDILTPTLISALGVDLKLDASQKGQANGVATLDVNSLIPVSQLPSYVDDVLEFFTLAAMPRPGQSGKIYIALNTNKQYRWPESGSDYVELVASPGTTDAIVEGAVNKWWTNARTIASVLTGIVFTSGATISAGDTILAAFGKLQKQITDAVASISGKLDATAKAADSDKLNGQTASFYTATMGAASEAVAGTKGLVAAPAAGGTRFWSSLGTWLTVTASASWGNITGTLANQTDLQAALNAKSSLGVGQTWVEVTSTRALATTYTNDTGKPIQVSIFGGPASANNVGYILTVDTTAIRFTYTNSGLFTSAANVIIPAGSTYRVVATNGNLPLYGWWELR